MAKNKATRGALVMRSLVRIDTGLKVYEPGDVVPESVLATFGYKSHDNPGPKCKGYGILGDDLFELSVADDDEMLAAETEPTPAPKPAEPPAPQGKPAPRPLTNEKDGK